MIFLEVYCVWLFFGILVILLTQDSLVNGALLLAENEYLQLKKIYDSTGGRNWKWKDDYARNGVPWSFHNYTRNNPCSVYWQGCYCMMSGNFSEPGHIFSIELTGMNLQGTLPETIEGFPQLLHFLVGNNNLHGAIPRLVNTPRLEMVNYSYNAFSGTVPDDFISSNYTDLNLIYLSNNYLTGPIPSIVYQFPNRLEYLNLFNNSFDGTISSEIQNLKNLFYLNLGQNKLVGTVPLDALGQLTKVRQLFLDTNTLTGPLPAKLSPFIDILWLSMNYFTGTIPYDYCHYSNITVIKLDYNFLTGQLPKCSNTLPLLYILQVQNNQLTGSLTNFFFPEAYKYLSVIDISDNAFSGSFPTRVFQLPSLKSIAAVKNCFIGNIPESICEDNATLASSLQVVALDGLHASSYCITHYWSPFRSSSSTGSFSQLMSGSLPCCLWRMPNITTLHFSGNGFTGTMPQFSSDLSNTLVDVSISHNRLTGTIPEVVLEHAFINLDLSYNKLYGSISHFTSMPFAYNKVNQSIGAALNLENNRLSGKIPATLAQAYNVEILEGNIFSCGSKLPQRDPNADNYICGSQELDSASLVFVVGTTGIIITIGIIILTILFLLKPIIKVKSTDPNQQLEAMKTKMRKSLIQSQLNRQIQYEKFVQTLKQSYDFLWYTYACILSIQDNIVKTYLHPYTCDEIQINLLKYLNLYQFLYSLYLIQKIAFFIAFFTILFCTPVYLCFYYIDNDNNDDSMSYSKYFDKYSWISTSVLLTGDAPAVTLLFLWYSLIVIVLIMIYYHYHIHYRKVTTWGKFKSFFGSMDEFTMNIRGSSSFMSPSTPPLDASNESQQMLKESVTALLDREERDEESEVVLSNTSFNRMSESAAAVTDRDSLNVNSNTNPVNIAVAPTTTTRDSLGNNDTAANRSNMMTTPAVANRFSSSAATSRVSFNNKGDAMYTPVSLQKERTSTANSGNRKSFLNFFNRFSTSSAGRERQTSFTSTSQYSMLHIVGDRISDLVHRQERYNQFKYYCLYITIFLINVIVGVSVNAAYLIGEDADDMSSLSKQFMQVFMAFFKLIWNIFIIRMMINQIQPYQRSVTRLHVFLLIFNSILAPCIATAFTDSSCFRGVFTVSDEITATYDFVTCTESTQTLNPSTGRLFTSCTKHVSLCYQTEFTPTFIYYYTCGSKLLTAYIPVFIYTYTILLIASVFLYTFIANINLKVLPSFLVSKIDGVLRPKEAGGSMVFERLIKGHSIQALLAQHIIVLLTFGINSPILAAIMALTIAVNCGIWQIMIIRYLKYDACCQKGHSVSSTSLVSFNSEQKVGDSGKHSSGTTTASESALLSAKQFTPIKMSHSDPRTERVKSPTYERVSDLTNSYKSVTTDPGLEEGTTAQKRSKKTGQGGSGTFNPLNNLKEEGTDKDEDEEDEEIIFPSNNSSLHTWDSTEFFRLTEEEETRLNELNTIIDDAWLCLYHTRWLIVYVALFFYILVLFDLAGDQDNAIHALWVPSVIVALIILTRLCIMDVLKYVQERWL